MLLDLWPLLNDQDTGGAGRPRSARDLDRPVFPGADRPLVSTITVQITPTVTLTGAVDVPVEVTVSAETRWSVTVPSDVTAAARHDHSLSSRTVSEACLPVGAGSWSRFDQEAEDELLLLDILEP